LSKPERFCIDAQTLVLLVLAGAGAKAQDAANADAGAPPLRLSPQLSAPPRGDAAREVPTWLRAQSLSGRAGVEAVAEGEVEFRRAGTVIRADRLTYDVIEDQAVARGNVRIARDGSVYRGPELQLRLQTFEGFFLKPEFDFARTGAGGRADRVDFIDDTRARATNAIYTSCPRDGSADPAWLLSTRSIRLDFEANEGIADGAVLRFLGVPLLAAPRLSFPITDDRKSGWLPPTVNLDNRSGLQLAVPWYWNIAPNRDATFTPRVATRRGLGLDTEFRYLEPSFEGQVGADWLPQDQAAGRGRYALRLAHGGSLAAIGDAWEGTRYALSGVRVSDDDWWKDFRSALPSFAPRLLPLRGEVERPFAWGGFEGTAYARMQRWQVLQSGEPLSSGAFGTSFIAAPYERAPQIGVRGRAAFGPGLEIGVETEVNRFTLADGAEQPVVLGNGSTLLEARPEGYRWHVLGSLARPWREPGWWVVPRLAFNAASYDLDRAAAPGAARHLARTIPTASIDAGVELERETQAFGRRWRQTLEPRLLYVKTPFRDQSRYPVFDSAGRDFSFGSIFTEDEFTGVDRVSDADQLTAGVTTRLVDPVTGAEALRLGIVQRLLFSEQRITPEGVPFTRRFSDLLLLGSTSVIPAWTLDGSLRYNVDINRPIRSILSARYTPGDFRTVGATYRYTRGSSEQLELGWQWPLNRPERRAAPAIPAAGGCANRWYSVGRFNYSLRDSRITDSLVGFELDAGCWIGRVVAERLSTGRSEATTRLMIQLELVGLSRLGSNPLKALKDNIPGYRLLREERSEPLTTFIYD
jgi:LPS-assembly protein